MTILILNKGKLCHPEKNWRWGELGWSEEHCRVSPQDPRRKSLPFMFLPSTEGEFPILKIKSKFLFKLHGFLCSDYCLLFQLTTSLATSLFRLWYSHFKFQPLRYALTSTYTSSSLFPHFFNSYTSTHLSRLLS